jgi:CBS domain-containing protein
VTATRQDESVYRLIARDPVQVWPDATLRGIAELLVRDQIGAVLVRGSEDASGIVSERDLVRAVAEGADPDADRADDLMTYELVSVDAATPVLEVARMMLEGEIRHVPVHDEAGLLGIVSMRDVLKALVEHIETPA